MAKQNTQLHIDLVYGYNQNRTEQNKNTWKATLSLSLSEQTQCTHMSIIHSIAMIHFNWSH